MKQIKSLKTFLILFYKDIIKKLQKSMEGSEFIINSVDSLQYKLHKASQNRSGSYTDYAKWLENKKATINPKNNENKCFQYAVTVSLNHEQIKIHTERIIKIKAFIDQYDLK